jgi:16S rRNA processing protein RimM
MTPARISERSYQAGSPQSGEPAFLAVGKLRRPHGVRGEIILEVWTDFPERLKPGLVVYVGPQHEPLHLCSRRHHAEGLLVAFEECATLEAVGERRSQVVYVPTADCPALPDGEYYHHQLLGLRVLSETGDWLGNVHEILETGANDVLVIRPEKGPDILFPLVESLLLAVDLAHGEMQVKLLPGLLPE